MKWATLDGFSKYEVSELGQVRIAATGEPMRFFSDGKDGYLKTKLVSDQGERVAFYIHRLVWQAFNGSHPIPPGIQIDHMDGDRQHNALRNLCPVSCRVNNLLKKHREGGYLFNLKTRRRKAKAGKDSAGAFDFGGER